jgi:hypothetical protein
MLRTRHSLLTMRPTKTLTPVHADLCFNIQTSRHDEELWHQNRTEHHQVPQLYDPSLSGIAATEFYTRNNNVLGQSVSAFSRLAGGLGEWRVGA